MNSRITLLVLIASLAISACQDEGPVDNRLEYEAKEKSTYKEKQVRFAATDGLSVYGTFYGSAIRPATATLLMLHQAGANGRAEYGPIVREFTEAGYNLFVLDQRSGGDQFGGSNRTAGQVDQGTIGYCDAIPDVDAAIDLIRSHDTKEPIFVIGSSYSAALAVRAAWQHPDKVKGFVAFSPASGEPMEGCEPEAGLPAAAKGFVLRPASEMEIERVADQLQQFEDAGARIMVVEDGVHGASMMVDDRTGHDMEPVRQAVIQFIREKAKATK